MTSYYSRRRREALQYERCQALMTQYTCTPDQSCTAATPGGNKLLYNRSASIGGDDKLQQQQQLLDQQLYDCGGGCYDRTFMQQQPTGAMRIGQATVPRSSPGGALVTGLDSKPSSLHRADHMYESPNFSA